MKFQPNGYLPSPLLFTTPNTVPIVATTKTFHHVTSDQLNFDVAMATPFNLSSVKNAWDLTQLTLCAE